MKYLVCTIAFMLFTSCVREEVSETVVTYNKGSLDRVEMQFYRRIGNDVVNRSYSLNRSEVLDVNRPNFSISRRLFGSLTNPGVAIAADSLVVIFNDQRRQSYPEEGEWNTDQGLLFFIPEFYELNGNTYIKTFNQNDFDNAHPL